MKTQCTEAINAVGKGVQAYVDEVEAEFRRKTVTLALSMVKSALRHFPVHAQEEVAKVFDKRMLRAVDMGRDLAHGRKVDDIPNVRDLLGL